MRALGAKPPSDLALARLAESQHGVVTRRQLQAAGMGRGAIAERIRVGRLHRIHSGVFAVGHRVLTRHGTILAAVLAGGECAAASHRTAAEIWGIGEATSFVEITVAGANGRTRAGIWAHRSLVPDADRTALNGIPVTTPGRTLTDLADVVPRRAVERAIDLAEYRRLDFVGLRPMLGRRGSGLIADVLRAHRAGSTMTRSEAEEVFLALCGRFRLPAPEVNARLEGHEVDFLWRSHRLVAEIDGYAAHGTRSAFHRDRRRDSDLLLAGYRVVRFTWSQLETDPGWVAETVLRLLAR
jgi:very-short-patch-repair endonuclease